MAFTYRVIPLADRWVGPRTARPTRSPFKDRWTGTLELLKREVRALRGTDVTLAVDVAASQIRLDGMLYSTARPKDPAVIVGLTSQGTQLAFPCDTYAYWEHNVRAIALAMEALRKVDRYGVRRGAQYAGFKALPDAGGSSISMSAATAAQLIAQETAGSYAPEPIITSVDSARAAIRFALSFTHPDRHTGSTERFHAVSCARTVLSAHHQTTL